MPTGSRPSAFQTSQYRTPGRAASAVFEDRYGRLLRNRLEGIELDDLGEGGPLHGCATVKEGTPFVPESWKGLVRQKWEKCRREAYGRRHKVIKPYCVF